MPYLGKVGNTDLLRLHHMPRDSSGKNPLYFSKGYNYISNTVSL